MTIRTTGIQDYLDGGEAYLKALIMGPPSAGKTRSASFWPKPIFADCEKGRMSIADRNVPYGEVGSQDDMRALIRALQMECMKPVQNRKYQTLVIDTLDAYQRIVIAERLRDTRKESMSGWEDWGYLDTKMTGFIQALMGLPMNIVVNLHVKDTKDGDDGPMVTGPKLKGDLREQIAAEFDLVGLMGVGYEAVNGERVLTRHIEWHPHPGAPMLKDRSGRLPRFTPVAFVDEDYTGLFTPLIQALDSLTESADVDSFATDADSAAAPVEPHVTGAVAAPEPGPVKRVAKKAAPPAAPAAPTGAAGSAPAPVAPTKNVPAARRPTPGLEVVDKNVPAGAEPAPVEVVPEGQVDTATGELTEAAEDQALALVAETLGAVPVEPQEDEDPPVESEPAPAPVPVADAGPVCGTPGRSGAGLTDNPVPGCGKSLATEDRDQVNITLIKTTREKRPTYLCPACMAAHKAAAV